MALNAELKINNDSECQIEDAALNAKQKKDMMPLNAELEINNDSESQTKDTTLNAIL